MIKTMMKNDAELIDLAIIGGGPAGGYQQGFMRQEVVSNPRCFLKWRC